MTLVAVLLVALAVAGFAFTQRLTAEQAARNEGYRQARAAAIAEQERQDWLARLAVEDAAGDAAEVVTVDG